MKRILFTLLAFTLSFAAVAQKKVDAVAKFSSEVINLGKIAQNVATTATFTITNISNEPLIIEKVDAACGCTVPDYTKAPIMPGKSGTIKATYNAANLLGFEKTVTLKLAGVDETKTLTLKGEVLSTTDFAKLKPATKSTPVKKVKN